MENIISDRLTSQGLELVEFIYRHEGRGLSLRVLADRPLGGITLEECAALNREIGSVLDDMQILRENYLLEVSSPGLDRPLKTGNDFLRCLNKFVHLFFSEPIDGKLELEGMISRVSDESVYINRVGIVIEVPLTKITKAKQIISNN